MKLSQALRIQAGDVVALVGGGGKTTAMFQLANELAPQMRVLTTTSTRIFAAQIKRAPAHVTFDPAQQTLAEVLPTLQAAIAQHGQVLLIGRADPDSGKAFGLPADIIDTLATGGHFEVIINEADGSRMRPFKAPAAHEPVIPPGTTIVVPVVGLDVLQQPLDDAVVHRANLVSRLSGTLPGQPVTPNTIATVLGHPQGGLKNVPDQARVVALLNKVDHVVDWGTRESGRQIAAQLLRTCERVDSVIIGSARQVEAPVVEVQGRVAAVILAAGASTRFGSPKQLVRWRDKTFIERAVEIALSSQARPVVVVLGAEVEHSRAILSRYPVEVVINKAWAEGQSTSLKAGLATLPSTVSSALFMLIDLPGVTPDIIDALIQRHRETLAPLVWPEFEGKRGNPVLFDRGLFPELRQISGDTGGKPVLMAYRDRAERVAVANPAILQDIDRPEDLGRL